jgi:hypothetical protein
MPAPDLYTGVRAAAASTQRVHTLLEKPNTSSGTPQISLILSAPLQTYNKSV